MRLLALMLSRCLVFPPVEDGLYYLQGNRLDTQEIITDSIDEISALATAPLSDFFCLSVLLLELLLLLLELLDIAVWLTPPSSGTASHS